MRITENRVLALVVCVICALASVLGIGGMKLKSQYDDTLGVFFHGSDAQHNIDYYLMRGTEYAETLAFESMQYLDDVTAAEDVLALVHGIEAGGGPECYNEYAALTDGVELLFSQLQTAGHDEETAIELAYYDYQSVRDLIKRDDYHECAREYNEMVSAFPAKLIAGMWGIGSVAGFGG